MWVDPATQGVFCFGSKFANHIFCISAKPAFIVAHKSCDNYVPVLGYISCWFYLNVLCPTKKINCITVFIVH
ncbi:MAG: hypothetical protein BGP13_06900 [Sphingobacteriales bacterium 40-81]|nr:MAG: hypothetical protein BGP13_06900 [Sphingobacteriales bacterium 40-81]